MMHRSSSNQVDLLEHPWHVEAGYFGVGGLPGEIAGGLRGWNINAEQIDLKFLLKDAPADNVQFDY